VLFSKEEAGRRIRALRDSRGMTQVELARALRIPQSKVSEMERGVRGLTVHQVVKLAKVLKVSTDKIPFGGNGMREQKAGASLKLVRRLQRIERLPEPRQRVVLKFIDALLDQESTGAGQRGRD
jgi:transcriptional regulator with XRE-family HTH domain